MEVENSHQLPRFVEIAFFKDQRRKQLPHICEMRGIGISVPIFSLSIVDTAARFILELLFGIHGLAFETLE